MLQYYRCWQQRFQAYNGKDIPLGLKSQFMAKINIYIYTWNPNDLYSWRSIPQNQGLFQSKQGAPFKGSRYLYISNISLYYIHTPWKINMEPSNHPFRKENDLPNLHFYVPCESSGVYIFFWLHFTFPLLVPPYLHLSSCPTRSPWKESDLQLPGHHPNEPSLLAGFSPRKRRPKKGIWSNTIWGGWKTSPLKVKIYSPAKWHRTPQKNGGFGIRWCSFSNKWFFQVPGFSFQGGTGRWDCYQSLSKWQNTRRHINIKSSHLVQDLFWGLKVIPCHSRCFSF